MQHMNTAQSEISSYKNAFELLQEMRSTSNTFDLQNRKVPYEESVIPKDGLALYNLVRATNSRVVFEIGFEKGTSTLHLLQAVSDLGGGLVVSIDPGQHDPAGGVGIRNVERAGLSQFHKLIELASEIALPRLLDQKMCCDLTFIDGNHRFDQTLLETFYLDKMLRVQGLMIFHDLWMPSIRSVAAWLESNLMYTPYASESEDLIVLRKTKEDCRDWNFFKHFEIAKPKP